VSVYCNGCRGFVAGPIGGAFAGLPLKLGKLVWTDSDEGCLMRKRAMAMKESSVTSVRSFDIRIIFRDPKVSVSSINTNAEAAARAANHSRATEKARMSCDETAAARGTKLVTKAPCLVICKVSVSACATGQEVVCRGKVR
jgi:hypothetical protein